MAAVTEGTILWQPSPEFIANSNIRHYMQWLAEHKALHFDDYQSLWQWSVDDLEAFWASLWEYFSIKSSTPYDRVVSGHQMPGAHWFEGARLNYAEHAFRNASPDRPALLFQSELQELKPISWETLRAEVASVAAALRGFGVEQGDRVVGYIPNIPQALVTFLACASVGAIWSSCSPDFGSPSVIDRFKQIEPKVLFAVDGYKYGGKAFDRREVVVELQQALPTVEQTVLVPYLRPSSPAPAALQATSFDEILSKPAQLTFEQLPFEHPLWVLYSSGTTGLPKPIVQGQGGILIEHLKVLALQSNVKPGDRIFWFTTTGWMMWNFIIGGLLVGATVLLYDGSPGYPSLEVLWQFAEQAEMTYFGTSAGFITSSMKAGVEPARFDLNRLGGMGSTGSPLPPEGFHWVYDHVRSELWLGSVSGGTDVCTAFISSSPLLPVRAGELQCRGLGCKVEAFDENGQPLIGQVGELVITEPMPSMPLFFWNDPGNRRYLESYFSVYPGIWRHGDWIKITPEGGAVIYGRSDSTLNRFGVRMGTSELYSAVEDLPEVVDSLVIDLEILGRESYMPLFVVLRPGSELDAELQTRIKQKIRRTLTPRHVPDDIFAIPAVPRTLNGKKLEVPVKKIVMGMPIDRAANPDSLSNPDSLEYFVTFGERLSHQQGGENSG